MCTTCKNTNCGGDCKAGQPKTICDLTPSGDIYYDGADIIIGATTVATSGDNLNDVLSKISEEVNNLIP